MWFSPFVIKAYQIYHHLSSQKLQTFTLMQANPLPNPPELKTQVSHATPLNYLEQLMCCTPIDINVLNCHTLICLCIDLVLFNLNSNKGVLSYDVSDEKQRLNLT